MQNFCKIQEIGTTYSNPCPEKRGWCTDQPLSITSVFAQLTLSEYVSHGVPRQLHPVNSNQLDDHPFQANITQNADYSKVDGNNFCALYATTLAPHGAAQREPVTQLIVSK